MAQDKRKIYFKYIVLPKGILRDQCIHPIPDIDSDLENFLIWFLPDFQSDKRIAHINDLYLEMESKSHDKEVVIQCQNHIDTLLSELKTEALEAFYNSITRHRIEIIYNAG